MPGAGRGILGSMAEPIRVALVDDDFRFLRSLRLLIDGSPGYLCVGAWDSVETALRAPELGPAEVPLL